MTDDNVDNKVLEERIKGLAEKVDYQQKVHDEHIGRKVLEEQMKSIEKRLTMYVTGISSAFIIIASTLTFLGYKSIVSITKDTVLRIAEPRTNEAIKAIKQEALKLIRITSTDMVANMKMQLETANDISKEARKKLIEIVGATSATKKEAEYTADDWYLKGTKEFFAKNDEVAIIDLNKAINIDHKFISAYHFRGNAYYRLKQYDKSIESDEEIIKLAPENIRALKNVSELKIITGKYESAMDSINKALSLSLHIRDKAVILYLKCIAEKLLNMDTTKTEVAFNKILKNDFNITWDFLELSLSIKGTDISADKKEFIEKQTEMLKKRRNKNIFD